VDEKRKFKDKVENAEGIGIDGMDRRKWMGCIEWKQKRGRRRGIDIHR
jgi:hypothetical protein